MRVKNDVWISAFEMDTPIEHLIPTTSNAGVCTTALVDFLTLTHNCFIERCQSLMFNDRSVNFYNIKEPVAFYIQCTYV